MLITKNHFTNTNNRELTIAAVMLYMGEGAKTGRTVDFVNSSVTLHRIFLSFLREVCQIDESRLKLYLYCFANQDLSSLVTFWSSSLEVKVEQFTKPYIRPAKISPRIAQYGVLHLRYSDKKLLEDILLTGQHIATKLIRVGTQVVNGG